MFRPIVRTMLSLYFGLFLVHRTYRSGPVTVMVEHFVPGPEMAFVFASKPLYRLATSRLALGFGKNVINQLYIA